MGRKEEEPPPPPPYYEITDDRFSNNNNYVLLLPPYHHSRRTHQLRRCVLSFIPIALFSALAIFFLFPSHPDLTVVRLRLDHLSLSTKKSSSSLFPIITLNVSLDLTLKVRNKDFFSMDYNSIVVSIGYRGRELGFVISEGGHVRARGFSYVNATLHLDGIEILHDVFYLLDDLAKGSIPFDTVTQFKGNLGLLFLDVPLKARMSCEVYVNTANQTIIRQDCYPE
ncbi:uncharacterized protein LOC143850977 [Tasmannia lanceolata]|uniref:uncharacterized protein LOC143850977 n=1 Tax=Tasmannia lanceolata TaxID=3420 RepID=UPI00406436AA